MSAHVLPLPAPLSIDMAESEIERSIDVEADDCGQVWIYDHVWNSDELTLQTTCFPTLDAAEAVALRLLAAVRAGRMGQ